MNSVTLAPGLAGEIRRHGAETYPHECCGALVGRLDEGGAPRSARTRITALVPLPNTTEEGPRRRFLVRPSDYRLAETRARELGGDLVGFYHSHPDHPARPSQYDLDHAWPTFAYVIVSIVGRDDPAPGAQSDHMTVWFLADDRSAFLEGSLTDGDHNPDSDTAAAVHGQA